MRSGTFDAAASIPASPRRIARLAVLLLLPLLLAPAGCRREPSRQEIRTATREMVRAIQGLTERRARITVEPQNEPPCGGKKAAPAPAVDHLYIALTAADEQARIEQELDRIAAKHNLKRAAAELAPGVTRIDYRAGRRRTHAIHIRALRSATADAAAPRLAIIIDDLGYDRKTAEALLALGAPLTVAVLPGLPHSAAQAEAAHRGGLEVLLHLPMESENGEAAETVELRAGMPSREAAAMVARMLDSVPHAVGANNHQGSRATRDARLMAAVMSELAARKLFFIDSRTGPGTVALRTAQERGVPAAARSVFLDAAPQREEIRRQLARAEHDSRQQGWAIAIGHPHPETLAVLRETLPQLEARGVRLVFASEVVR